MKNLFLLPTDKPTRLHFDTKLFLSPNYQDSKTINSIVEGINTYITSDEEIKKGDWVLFMFGEVTEIVKVTTIVNNAFETKQGFGYGLEYCKKIILTTDQDLIKDGVQAIDDEFLEWFVKNSSCEKVETYSLGIKNEETGESCHYEYEIIIPKEEPISFPFFDKEKADAITKEGQKVIRELQSSMKQELNLNCFDCNKSLQDCTCMEDTIDMKQETLEEAADKLFPSCGKPLRKIAQKGFIAGAKWQTEKMYSEKEVLNILNEFCDNFYENSIREDIIIKWFEQFKKKA